MRRIFALVICAALACACFAPACAESGAGASGIPCSAYVSGGESFAAPMWAYETLPDGTACVTAYYGRLQNVVFPDSVDGIPVSRIAAGALPDADVAGPFDVYIPDSVTVIDPDAFSNVHGRIRCQVSDTHPTLQAVDGALISVPEKRIVRGAISGDYAIPDGIETVDSYAFYDSNCSSIYIPESVTTLGRNPFAGCNSSPDNRNRLQQVTVSPDNAALYLQGGALFSRADRRLVWCWDLSVGMLFPEFNVPRGIEEIDDLAFQRWPLLTSVIIPASVTRIGANPFAGCRNPDVVHLEGGNTALALDGHLLLSREDHRVVACLARETEEPIAVPEGTTAVGDFAFYGLQSASAAEVTLPASVTSVGAYAFCYTGVRPVIPAGVRSIGYNAFSQCSGLTELPAFSGPVDIGAEAFSFCSGITVLNAPAGAVIRPGAFENCSGLREVRVGPGDSRVLFCAFVLCGHLEYAEFSEGLVFLGESAFRMCGALQEVYLPASLAWIDEYALVNAQEMEYNADFDTYMTLYKTTLRVRTPAGSPAEQFCRDHEIECAAE